MRNNLCFLIVMAGCIGVAGCATQNANVKEQGITADEISAIRQQGIQPAVGVDVDLGEKTKGKIVAMKSLQVIAGILGGGVQAPTSTGPRNQEPIGGYTVTDGHAMSFTAQQLSTFKGPASAEAVALNQKIQAMNIPVTAQSTYSLKTSATAWGIDYDKLTEKDDYRLYYSVNVDLMQGTKHVLTMNCQGATQDMRALDAWNANDHALVNQDAAVIGDICADKALATMGLAPSGATGAAASIVPARTPQSGSSSG